MIQDKLKELELQLNYVCYDEELITRLSKVWDAYYALKAAIGTDMVCNHKANEKINGRWFCKCGIRVPTPL
jgi:hypothetical protein